MAEMAFKRSYFKGKCGFATENGVTEGNGGDQAERMAAAGSDYIQSKLFP